MQHLEVCKKAFVIEFCEKLLIFLVSLVKMSHFVMKWWRLKTVIAASVIMHGTDFLWLCAVGDSRGAKWQPEEN